jgi:hypothetical protein
MLDQLKTILNAILALQNDPRVRLLLTVQKNIGSRITKEFSYGCAEAVNKIHELTFGKPIGGDVSTIRLYQALCNDKTFVRVISPLPGDIIINQTVGNNTGHTGFILFDRKIASNSSINGRFMQNYTLDSWNEYFVTHKRLQSTYFRKLSA